MKPLIAKAAVCLLIITCGAAAVRLEDLDAARGERLGRGEYQLRRGAAADREDVRVLDEEQRVGLSPLAHLRLGLLLDAVRLAVIQTPQAANSQSSRVHRSVRNCYSSPSATL